MRKFLNTGLLTLTIALICLGDTASQDLDLEVIRTRLIDQLLGQAHSDSEIDRITATQNPDGTWSDIDYIDTSRTGFQHHVHLDRMVRMAHALVHPSSDWNASARLAQKIDNALGHWISEDYTCANWWWNQIGTPRALVDFSLLMDEHLSRERIAELDPIIRRGDLQAWGTRPGGDRVKIAGIYAKYCCYLRQSDSLDQAVDVIGKEIKTSPGRGLKTDLSFHHRRDRVTSTLSYGAGFAHVFAEWAFLLRDTKYSLPEEGLRLLIDFYLDGICQTMVYGKYPDLGAKNRSISRPGTMKAWSPDPVKKLAEVSSYRSTELQRIILSRTSDRQIDFPAKSRYFWHSEYLSYQANNYFASVRLHSARNHTMEKPYNQEGLKNHHLGEGASFVSITGQEYYDIFPVWDWQKIPGTTIVQKPSLPSSDSIQKKGKTTFVGGAASTDVAACAFDYVSVHDKLQAKKSWFFVAGKIACLAAGIQSGETYPVITTIDQCHSDDGITVWYEGLPTAMQDSMLKSDELQAFTHADKTIVLMQPTRLQITNEVRKGRWTDINHQSDTPTEELPKKVFTAAIEHGSMPQDASYAYLILPNLSHDGIKNALNNPPVRILTNNEEVQAVQFVPEDVIAASFFAPGVIYLDDLKIEALNPLVMTCQIKRDNRIRLVVADPTHELKSLRIRVDGKHQLVSSPTIAKEISQDKGSTEIEVVLPIGEYAGSSVVVEMR